MHASSTSGLSAGVSAIVDIARRVGLRGTTCARWRADTIRFRLPEVAGRIKKMVRRIRLCLTSAVPLQDVFARTLVNLHSAAWAPPE